VAEPRSVVNASPLIFLAAADALYLLPQSLSEVLPPRAVLEEILAGRDLTSETLDAARDRLDSYAALTVRDALHAAVAVQTGAEAICTYDRDFHYIAGLRRLEP